MHSYVGATRNVLLGTVFVILTGITVYQASINYRLRDNILSFEQQQQVLRDRNAALESEHKAAENQDATVSSTQDQTSELLKLRAEVTRLNKIVQEQSNSAGKRRAGETDPQQPSLDPAQRKFLADMTENIETKNSVADIDRLKDTLTRWDELSTNMFPAKMMPVVPMLKQKVIERLAQLEAEAARK